MNQSYIIVATLSMLTDEGRRILFMLTVRYTILRNKLCAHDKVTMITRVTAEAKRANSMCYRYHNQHYNRIVKLQINKQFGITTKFFMTIFLAKE